MLHKAWQRCIASLIVMVTVVGVFAPPTVFAPRTRMTNKSELPAKIKNLGELRKIAESTEIKAKYTTEFYYMFYFYIDATAGNSAIWQQMYSNNWNDKDVDYNRICANCPIATYAIAWDVMYGSYDNAPDLTSAENFFGSYSEDAVPKWYKQLVDWIIDKNNDAKNGVYNYYCGSTRTSSVTLNGSTHSFGLPSSNAGWLKDITSFYKHVLNESNPPKKSSGSSGNTSTNKHVGKTSAGTTISKRFNGDYDSFIVEGLTTEAQIYEYTYDSDKYVFMRIPLENNHIAYANLGGYSSNRFAPYVENDFIKIDDKPIQLRSVAPMQLYTKVYETGVLENWSAVEEHYAKMLLDDSGSMSADTSNLGARMALFLSAINEWTVDNRVGFFDNYEEVTHDSCASVDNLNSTLSTCLKATIEKSTEVDDLFTMNSKLGLINISEVNKNHFKRGEIFGGALGIINTNIAQDPPAKNDKHGLWGKYTHAGATFKLISDVACIPTSDTVTCDSYLRLTGVTGAELCLAEYANPLVNNWINSITKDDGWKSDKGIAGTLVYFHAFDEAFGEVVPLVHTIYTTKDSKCNKSYEDLYNEAGLDGIGVNDVDPSLVNQNTYQVNYDKSTPIGDFYILNGNTGITSYDRDKILGDVTVNTAYDVMNAEEKEQNDRDNTYEGYNVHEEDNILDEDDSAFIGSGGITSIKDQIANSVLKDSNAYGIDESGISTSNESVTMSDYIVKGMAYSTTFMPMRTNLYSAETLKQFDENFLNDFYYKYGFMRKALYVDQSATSAMDYYNNGGKLTGQTRVVTLRDLIENDGEDVTLYLDDNFYNSKQIIEQVPVMFEAKRKRYEQLLVDLNAYADAWDANNKSAWDKVGGWIGSTASKVASSIISWLSGGSSDDSDEEVEQSDYDRALETMDWSQIRDEFSQRMLKTYDVDINAWEKVEDVRDYADDLEVATANSASYQLDDHLLKNGDETTYDDMAREILSDVNSGYLNLNEEDHSEKDSTDTIVLSSRQIKRYMSMSATHSEERIDESTGEEQVFNEYTVSEDYSPMLSFAFVSCLYRNGDLYSLANTVANNNPVFMASDDLCGVSRANQWYRNTLLNYAFMKNLKSAAQIDYAYCVDLDCPLYMDVFGNILTESGTVVVPAAANATLHTGAFKNFNVAMGFYAIYGHDYSIPLDVTGAYSVCNPYLIADLNADVFTLNGVQLTLDNTYKVNLARIDNYDSDVLQAVQEIYLNTIVVGNSTVLNWMAMVNVCNEVMRGAPIEYIDKSDESLYTNAMRDKSATAAAVKFEGLLDSLQSRVSNTLISIPDFSKIDGLEFYVALFIKLLMVATSAVVIIFIYRDGSAGMLSWRTAWQSLSAIALTVTVLVSVPAVFQLTYYGANKMLLEDESIRILMVNTEKNSCGVEIGMTDTREPKLSDNFSIQLDFISVPWYKQLGAIMNQTSRDAIMQAKMEAYRETPMYNNSDVTVYNDGVYVTAGDLFDSTYIDYNFANQDASDRLYIRGTGGPQTASFYSPYYVFLKALVKDVNYYNENITDSNNYTTKYVAGTKLKTVGLCNNYFTSKLFMEETGNYFFLEEIYGINQSVSDSPFTGDQVEAMHQSLWYNSALDYIIHEQAPPSSWDQYKIERDERKARKKEAKANGKNPSDADANAIEYLNEAIYNAAYNDYMDAWDDLNKRIDALDEYARKFISENKDMLTKVTDETFLKCFALNMAIKYNQLFGVNAANSLEIYNMDSNDLLRLCVAKSDEAVMTTPMSYARYIYNFGGESGIYAATILEIIMWAGSFLKPLCTIIVFISIFASLWVFKVLLRRKSNNIMGYVVTMLLLCGTNFLHSLILKVSVNLPNLGLSTLACLIFMIVGQVLYLLVLAYVTGVSLKDWANLGATEYEKEAAYLTSKFKKNDTTAMLSGRIKHHENNWDYYDDLINQHRSRNMT